MQTKRKTTPAQARQQLPPMAALRPPSCVPEVLIPAEAVLVGGAGGGLRLRLRPTEPLGVAGAVHRGGEGEGGGSASPASQVRGLRQPRTFLAWDAREREKEVNG